MFEELEEKQKYGLIAGIIVVGIVGFVSGFALKGFGIAQPNGTSKLSQSEIKGEIQPLLDAQMQKQRQQFSLIANQSKNISEEDLSIKAEVTDVSESKFASLYKVTVLTTGTVPSQLGGLQDISQNQTMYISRDGKYLFGEPTNLDTLGQQNQQTIQ